MEAVNAVRLLPYAAADGPHNMAADEVLLEVGDGGHAPRCGSTAGREPTLSLGYFQPQPSAFPIRA